MTDKELAERIIAVGTGIAQATNMPLQSSIHYRLTGQVGSHFEWQSAEQFVRDWRVVGALMEMVDLLKDFRQMVFEVSHAYECGSGWYTKGESGLRNQVRMWIERGRKSSNIDFQDPRAIIEACVEVLS